MSARRQYALTVEHEDEKSEQRTLTKVFRMELAREAHVSEHGVCWFSIDMSNSNDTIPGIRIARGIPAGVPDVIVIWQGKCHWIEMKSRDGVLSDPQRSVVATLLLSGCKIGVACDWSDALKCLDTWGIPRKRLIKVEA
jgi:hypothetical protein